MNFESCFSSIIIKTKAMNNKIKYLITTFLLFAFVGLFAQETINENNPSNSLGKKGAKMML